MSPIPNSDDSTAEVFLRDEGLPPVDTWEAQFRSIVNGTYELRGVEAGAARIDPGGRRRSAPRPCRTAIASATRATRAR